MKAMSPKQGRVPIRLPRSSPVTLSILNWCFLQLVVKSLLFVKAWSAKLSMYTILGSCVRSVVALCSLIVRA